MKTLLPIIFALLSLVLCIAAQPNIAAEELDIREATFRYQFQKNASGQQQRTGAYYLCFQGKNEEKTDPPTDFINRFAGNKPPVKKVSECNASAKGVVDKKTGESGLVFNIGDTKWISDNDAEIYGGYYEAGLSASGSTYYLKKVDGKWKVIKDVMHLIK